MEMLNKAAELLPQRMCKTRFASRCVPLGMPAERLAVTFQSKTTPSRTFLALLLVGHLEI